MHTETLTEPRRELARRSGGGIEVTLYWSALNNCTTIEIRQTKTDETRTFAVRADRALDDRTRPRAAWSRPT